MSSISHIKLKFKIFHFRKCMPDKKMTYKDMFLSQKKKDSNLLVHFSKYRIVASSSISCLVTVPFFVLLQVIPFLAFISFIASVFGAPQDTKYFNRKTVYDALNSFGGAPDGYDEIQKSYGKHKAYMHAG